jgi:very-short-patch-repair endonuclease
MSKIKGEEDFAIYFGAKPELFRLAGELRHSMTPAEKLLWEQLRERKMMGYRFRRQHPFNIVILDFFCYKLLLSIEVDGSVHSDPSQKERDKERTNY